ncbi:unnamed protein product, partial [Merluccius merluccius]
MDVEDVDGHVLTAIENMGNLEAAWASAPSAESFLRTPDVRVPLHASTVRQPSAFLNCSFDLDGVHVELEEVTAVTSGLNFLFLPPVLKVKKHFFLHRKHVDLQAYSVKGRKALRNCCGVVLAHLHGALFLNLTAMPKDKQTPNPILEEPQAYTRVATEALNEVRENFAEQLQLLSEEDVRRPSFMKQCLSLTAKFEVLPQDLKFVLTLVQRAINHANQDDEYVTLVPSVTKFGQKLGGRFDLAFLDLTKVQAMSVHFALDLVAKDRDLHLLWSRFGLQQVVGLSCSSYSVLGMHECINVQTPLDGRPLDIKHPLLKVLKHSPVRFVQLYVPSPHVHFPLKVNHPISGILALCDLQHQKSREGMQNAATMYLRHVHDAHIKMVGQQGSRLEYVGYFSREGGIPAVIQAGDFFDMPALASMLENFTVLVPIMDTKTCSLPGVLNEVMDHIASSLSFLLASNMGKGGFEACWKAYQMELAFEELVYGHPLGVFDRYYSPSLGTCSVSPRSATCLRGFIGLSAFNSAAVGDSPPPLNTWTGNSQLIQRVRRLFPLTEVLEAAPCVVGAVMLRVILSDLYNTPAVPLYILTTEKLPDGMSLTGSVTVEGICQKLVSECNFSFPHTFGRGKKLVEEAGFNAEECLVLGFQELGLKFFPVLRMTDAHRYCVRIAPNLYLAVHGQETEAPKEARLAALTGDICQEVERRSLSYYRNLERFQFYGMPWLEAVERRLPPLGKTPKLLMLTFLSCVGMRMNGEFIDYNAIKELVRDMPLSQATLQKRLILGQELMEKVTALRLWKLHKAIPYRLFKKLPPKLPPTSQKALPPEDRQEPEELVRPEVLQDFPALKSTSKVLPLTTKLRWSAVEMDLVSIDTKDTHRVAYSRYVQACQTRNLCVRTFSAFRQRRAAMM